jgi:hypothetical protein
MVLALAALALLGGLWYGLPLALRSRRAAA